MVLGIALSTNDTASVYSIKTVLIKVFQQHIKTKNKQTNTLNKHYNKDIWYK